MRAPSSTSSSDLRRIAVGLALFALVLTVLDHGVWAALDRLKRGSGAWDGQLERLYDGRLDADVLLFGSSRMLTHVDPTVIEAATGLKAYNLGLDGTGLDQHLFTLAEAVRFNRAPRVVVLGIDVSSFADGVEPPPGAFHPYALKVRSEIFRPYAMVSDEAYRLVNGTRPGPAETVERLLYRHLLPSLAFRDRVLDVIAAARGRPREEGAGLRHVKGAILRPPRPGYRNTLEGPLAIAYDAAQVDKLERVVEFCREHGLALVLVEMPWGFDIRAVAPNFAEIQARIEQAAARPCVGLVDLTADPDFRDPSLYIDAAHLDSRGAEAVSRKLAPVVSRALRECPRR